MAERRELGPVIIAPASGWPGLELANLWEYRELIWFLGIRDVAVRYKQTALGPIWALVQPLSTILVFSFFFGRVAKIPSDGLPYPVFSMAGLVVWSFFASGLTRSAGGLLSQAGLLSKVYFPRLVAPVSAQILSIIDGMVGCAVLAFLMVAYGTKFSPALLGLPVIFGLAVASSLGFGIWASALTVRYRDLHHALPFVVQLWMYATPVIYPVSAVTRRLEAAGIPGWLYGLNPMAGAAAAARALVRGGEEFPWLLLAVSSGTTVVVLVTGVMYFRKIESLIADDI